MSKFLSLLLLHAAGADDVTCGQLKAVYSSNSCCGGAPSTAVASACPLFSSIAQDFRLGSVISSGELLTLAEKDFVQVVDVRNETYISNYGTFRHAINCPVSTSEDVPNPNFPLCVSSQIIKNIPVVFACNSGNEATLALNMAQDSGFLTSWAKALKPGGISTISGYPVDADFAYDFATQTASYPSKLFNSYVSATTAIGMIASKHVTGGGYDGIHLIDIRSSFEFGMANISFSTNVPLLTDPFNETSLNPAFKASALSIINGAAATDIVILYCASGSLANAALTALFGADPSIATKRVFALQGAGFGQIYDPFELYYHKGALFMHAFNSLMGTVHDTSGISATTRASYNAGVEFVKGVIASNFLEE